MFLRKLKFTTLIISVSLGLTFAAKGGEQDVIRVVNAEGAKEGTFVVFVPDAPTQQSSLSIEDLHFRLLSVFLTVNSSYDANRSKNSSNPSLNGALQKRAQYAERRAQQNAEKQKLGQVTKSFKPSPKSLHQPR